MKRGARNAVITSLAIGWCSDWPPDVPTEAELSQFPCHRDLSTQFVQTPKKHCQSEKIDTVAGLIPEKLSANDRLRGFSARVTAQRRGYPPSGESASFKRLSTSFAL